MKQIVIPVLLSSIIWLSCKNNDSQNDSNPKILADTTQYTQIQWLDSVVNFGNINMGEKIKVVFRFKNTGTKPLVLAEVKAGCGCTVPDYTKGAIAPGAQGEVTGAFDSNKSHPGEVRKSIFVTTNTHDKTNHTLIFTGLIKELAK
jgi:hypothetical protein